MANQNPVKILQFYLILCVTILGMIVLLRRTTGPFSTIILDTDVRKFLNVCTSYNYTPTIEMNNSSLLYHSEVEKVQKVNETKTARAEDLSDIFLVGRASRLKILIFTYMRSGSTLTSGIVQQSGNAFFSMEPLWGIYRRCYRRKYNVCCRNDKCRSPTGELEGLQVAITAIKDILNCEFNKLGNKVLSSFTFFSESSGNTRLRNNQCFQFSRNETLTEWCLKYLTSVCEASSGVIVKTLRLSAETLSFLKDIVPDMKIVHLFRDPRGVLISRKNFGDFIDRNTNISIYARQLCNRMSHDIDVLKSLGMHYIPLRYECLSDNPDMSVRKLYKGLNITVTKAVEDWIDSHMRANSSKSGGYGFQYKNSSVVAHSWRYSLDLMSIKAIDSMCSQFYDKTGIIKISNMSDLRNPGFLTYSGNVYSKGTC